MTQSTTIANGVDVRIMIAKAVTLVLTDVSGSANKVEIRKTNELGVARTFQTRWPLRLAGPGDVQVNLTVYYSTATDEGLELLRTWFMTYNDDARNVQIDMPDDNVGSNRYTLPCKLSELNIPAEAGSANPIEVTATLMLSGTPTVSAIAT